MAEWLGTGLQNRLQPFESAWYLKKGLSNTCLEDLFSLLFICIFSPERVHTFNNLLHLLIRHHRADGKTQYLAMDALSDGK